MPKYYFDLRQGNQIVVDEHGEELRDADAARHRAVQCTGEMIRDYPMQPPSDHVLIEARQDQRVIWRVTARLQIEDVSDES